MIVHGGEPPFIEKPEPKFGGVVKKLNEITYKLQDCTYSFNENSKTKLQEFAQNLAQFIVDVVTPIDNHLAQRGAVHGETKSTIGLSKKDNYRTATLTEQANLTPVLAYVTPQGVKAALDKNIVVTTRVFTSLTITFKLHPFITLTNTQLLLHRRFNLFVISLTRLVQLL